MENDDNVKGRTTQNSKEIVPTQNMLSLQSDISNCGYVTQLHHPESTSSNNDYKQYHRRLMSYPNQRFNVVNNPQEALMVCCENYNRRKRLVQRRNTM